MLREAASLKTVISVSPNSSTELNLSSVPYILSTNECTGHSHANIDQRPHKTHHRKIQYFKE